MRGLLIALFTFGFSVAFAQDQQAVAPVEKADYDKNVWVELNLPISKNGGFGDAIGDSRRSSSGAGGLTLAWEPYRNSTSSGKKYIVLRNLGFTFNATVNSNNPDKIYDAFLGSVYTELSPFEETTTCGGQYGGGKQCVPCGYGSFGVARRCTVENIYGRATPIKYSTGSAALGVYMRREFADLMVQIGVNARIHMVQEGQFSNELDSSTELTSAATIRVAYPVYKNLSASAGYEQSFAGSKSGNSRFRYRVWTIGVTARW